MRIYDTSAYISQLFAGTFSREGFLNDALAAGAPQLHVQVRFFPERAMYWTRMMRNAAAEKGMALTTLELSSELIADERTVRAQQLNLSEWIRIAALSKIGSLCISVDGEPGDLQAAKRLVDALSPLMEMTRLYGTVLILSSGSAQMSDAQLLEAAKALGYASCRVKTRGTLLGCDAQWAA